MSQELTVLGISAAITAGIQLSGFAVAYALQTETFYDILGKLVVSPCQYFQMLDNLKKKC